MKNTKYWIRNYLGSQKSLFPLLSIFPRFRRKMITSDTDIVIEGFPRSGNSFMCQAFKLWNPDTKIAHHIHVPMQIICGVDQNIPCIVLIREPAQALASLFIVDRSLSLDLAIQSYADFYERIWNFRNNIVISNFEITISSPDITIRAVNRKYGTGFHCKPLKDEDKKIIITILKKHHASCNQPNNLIPIPMESKKNEKNEMIKEIYSNVKYIEAEKIYNKFISFSIEQIRSSKI